MNGHTNQEDTMLKFYWNGIKEDGGTLQLCTYHMGALTHHPEGTITIYGKRYRPFSDGVNRAFTIQDDSEILSDYIVNEHIRVTPDHPLYAQVYAAYQKKAAHDEKRYAKRNEVVAA
jgi:hypothetical protein